jgi:hypothetical protein
MRRMFFLIAMLLPAVGWARAAVAQATPSKVIFDTDIVGRYRRCVCAWAFVEES